MEFSPAMKSQSRRFNRQDLVYEARIEREIEKNVEMYRAKMQEMYATASNWDKPRAILAEGDSWFRYVAGAAVILYLDNKPLTEVLNLAWPGDELHDMLSPRQRKRLIRELKRGPARRRKYDAFLFSGGGNDLLGDGRFRLWLNDYEDGMSVADVINKPALKGMLDYLVRRYEEIIAIRDSNSPKTKLYFHSYDFALPTGKGVCGRGPWLRPGLDMRKVPRAMQADVVAHFLKQFDRRLKKVTDDSENIELIATQGTLTEDEWANEIHPKAGGFRKIANKFYASIETDFPRQ